VELGVTDIQPVVSERSSATSGGPSHHQDKANTWVRVVRKAAIQCRRAILPELLPPTPLAGMADTLLPNEALLCMDVVGKRQPLFALAPALVNRPLTLLVGPEGGWSDQERKYIQSFGGIVVSVGSRVLRTETAGMAALAVLAAADGTFTPGEDL
ncbi:MAG: RNA methyltransferase, partial [Magnetococcales bacterium]|nr:RNA methyltransferase [Magnetococcales bacterium]